METQRKGLDAADTGNKRACLLCRAIARCCRAKPLQPVELVKIRLDLFSPMRRHRSAPNENSAQLCHPLCHPAA